MSWMGTERASVTQWRKKVSRKDGLSLVRREEQGNTVSEILGDLDGHLDRSWLVSMGDTRHDDDVFCLDKLLQNGSELHACTVKRGRVHRQKPMLR